MKILLILIILAVIVVSHEFGHFITARLNGIRVKEFAFGVGPDILSFKRKGTKFAWKLLPFGGYCMYDGLEMEEESQGELFAAEKSQEEETFEAEEPEGIPFLQASVVARITTIFAGPMFNILLGFFIALIVVGIHGTDLPVIQQVQEGSPAMECGLKEGDVITSIDGESIHVYREISLISALNKEGRSMRITYTREGEPFATVITPSYSEADQRYYMGLYGSGEYHKCTGLQVLSYGYYETCFIVKNTMKSLKMLVTGRLGGDDISGPVGMANTVGETYQEVKQYGFSVVVFMILDYILILSVNLGIMNLLPLPALDGGRLLFLFWELIWGKPVPPEKEGLVHMAGFVLLFVIMFLVLFNDIAKMF